MPTQAHLVGASINEIWNSHFPAEQSLTSGIPKYDENKVEVESHTSGNSRQDPSIAKIESHTPQGSKLGF